MGGFLTRSHCRSRRAGRRPSKSKHYANQAAADQVNLKPRQPLLTS
ncbi:hypothetical protein P3T35_006926 [Kitasatospora sp. GP30]|nr:hypothetical protein [Kitasatospora sp. GP30]